MASGLEDGCDLQELRRSGEAGAAELFRRYRDKLLRMIAARMDARILGKVDSEDVLQDAFVEVVRRLDRYLQQPAVPVFVWLRQVTGQVLIDLHRRYLGARMRDARQEVGLWGGGFGDPSAACLAAHLADSLTSPSQSLARAEAVAGVREALAQLGPIDREILVLRHLEELNNNEVAQVLGIDKCAASKRYLRALRRLRGVLPADRLPC